MEKQPTRVVIDVGGVGHEVFIPLSSYDRLPPPQSPCRLLTYDHVREDIHQLFGFVSEAERDMFVLLLGTTGIGPRIALSALSGMSVRDLKLSIAHGDAKRLTTISGVGRKLAERMVLELRDKIGEAEALEAMAGADELPPGNARIRDALMALIALGYKEVEARKMVADVVGREKDEDLDVEDIIRKALTP